MSSALIRGAMTCCAVACVCLLSLTKPAWGQADITATFNNNLQGWLAVDYPYYTHFENPSTTDAGFDAVNGLPPGSLRIADVFGETGIAAPPEWLGDKSAYYGGHLSYDIFIRETDGLGWTAVTLNAGPFSIYRETPPPPLGAWEHRSIRLTEECWFVNLSNAQVSRSLFLEVLSNLTGLYIATEWKTGEDDTNVDNIVLSALPTATTADADFNADSRVNHDDVAVFLACASGPNLPYAPECNLANNCGRIAADFDNDGDVDQTDFGVMQRCFSGNKPADPKCTL